MKTGFRQVSITTAPEVEESVGWLLQGVFGQPYSVFTRPEHVASVVSVFLPETQKVSQCQRAAVAQGMKIIDKCGLNLDVGELEVKRLKREDWADSWKKNFKPVIIKGKLVVKPSWEKAKQKAGQKTVVVDPGLSFGTGQHVTTKYCLRQIIGLRRSGQPQSFMDVGAGTGILSIAAAKMGYRPVQSLDLDPEAVRVARSNAKRNHVEQHLKIRVGDVARLSNNPRVKYDMVCANLLFDLLNDHASHLVAHVKIDGVLVLAGVLRQQFSQLEEAYKKEGLKLKHTDRRGEWQSGCFIFGS